MAPILEIRDLHASVGDKPILKGINLTIVDARFAKPLDEKLILEVASNHELILTIEEGSIGGFGSHVMIL